MPVSEQEAELDNSSRQKWDARYRSMSAEPAGEPSSFLREMAERLPCAGRCLDLAGGAGRNALWLAERGLSVTLADISSQGLQLAGQRARRRGVDIALQQVDLTRAFPAGPWRLIVSLLYLDRALFVDLAEQLAPGGQLLFLQPTSTNLQRHPRPSRRFLLEPGELSALLPPTLEVQFHTEQWSAAGHHEARLLAQKR